MKDKEQFYILSVGFFKFFYDTYGCNQIIQVKYLFLTQQVEINPATLSDPNDLHQDSNIIHGYDCNAIYENLYDLLRNPLLIELR